PGGNLNITIRNGFIQSGVTNNGSGTYTGSGFAYGIASSSPPSNVRVKDISISGCADSGIYLNMRNSTVVESCVVQTAGGYGIYASQVIRSVVRDCGAVAILGDNVSDCQAQNTSSVYGIEADTVQNCTAFSSSGYAIIANSAINCYASCTSGTGLNSTVAQNCYGYSGGAGTGILDTLSQNCYGSSNTGFGVDAANALNCYGHSTSGTGLYASQANSCYGNTESITYKYNMP
ncbi:MAG: hypothetical protein KGR98_08805, partial [Verrucomicrobia bacterium]|nr:hypothetical protein [Verrucomicrobiota bacterium]